MINDPCSQKILIKGYGDEAAEMLAARFISERMERFETWLHARGFKTSFFQVWIDSKRYRVHLTLQGSHPASQEAS